MVKTNRKIIFYALSLMLYIFILSPMVVNCEELRIFDDANLFTEKEILELHEEANLLSNDYDMDIIIVTTNDANGKTAEAYADDFFDYNGFGVGPEDDGILFLIDMDNTEAHISTTGIGIKYLTDKRIDSIIKLIFDRGIEDGDYYNATKGFLSGTKEYLEMGIPKNTLTFLETIISLIASLGAAAAFFFSTKSKYKMKNPTKPLTFRNNSIVNLVSNENTLVDSAITNRIIPKSTNSDSSGGKSTTHTSSSGKTHGGGGKKF